LWNEKQKKKMKGKELSKRPCISALKYKEDTDTYVGLVATSHPDRVGDILSTNALTQIKDFINSKEAGGPQGSYRSLSVAHDWIHEQDPTKDEAAMMRPNATIVDLEGGHKGVEVEFQLNKFYKGDMTPEEIKFRIDNGSFAGLSIEYDTDEEHSKTVQHNGESYRFIDELTQFGGAGLARARMIANPMAVVYKEIESKAKEVNKMTDEPNKQDGNPEAAAPEDKAKELADKEKELAEREKKLADKEKALDEDKSKKDEEDKKAQELEDKEKLLQEKEIAMKIAEGVNNKLSVKEIMESKEFKDEVRKAIKIDTKVLKTKEGEQGMDKITLSVKEINASLDSKDFDVLRYKEASSNYFEANKEAIEEKFTTTGIPLNTTLKVKCVGTKLKVVGRLQTKDTLDTTTNTSTYTQNISEFADVYLPGLIETFNDQNILFGKLQKKEHLMGGDKYGWRIKTSQRTTMSVDPDDNSVVKTPVSKLKLQTPIKEYRPGISVSDYTLHHSRGTMGDLFAVEVEATMRDLMRDINNDLFTEQADGDGTKILGLEAVADSAGNNTLYGLTRSSANRLAPDSATDTYTAVGGALTTANIRLAARKPELDGAMRGNLRIIVNPVQRDKLFELKESARRFNTDAPVIGFNAEGNLIVDGIPMWVDSSCQVDAWFVVDLDSYYVVVSRAPQLIGLAKVGAAKEAYISLYFAVVYENPRRIYMLDTLTST